jgi:branched-chain amino acid aminotransferase
MHRGIETLLGREDRGTQYVRPIAYRRGPELWVTGAEGRPVDVTIFTVPTARDVNGALSCQISPVERISSRSIPGQTKVSGAYVNSFIARRQAELDGFNDALMLDRDGRVAEASAANVFFVDGRNLITPPANPDVFPGVTRSVILELADRIGVSAREEDLRCEDLDRFDGAFICSTLMEVRPLNRLGDRELQTGRCDAYIAVLEEFRRITHQ